ncbi:MAG: L-fucose/L-arabinose isomerase family protein [Lachnospiraceae bacterium]|nr:L-fucose/L-arabinose isomerase family protein [Lachnospiraceae bacterium]
MDKILLGFAPTRRSIFSAPDAVKYADLTREKLRDLGIRFVDIKDLSEDGLLHADEDRVRIEEKFREEGIDGIFFPHTNFGTEYEVARLAKSLGVPVLLWGPRDERPAEDGVRLRDSQCGLFATGKVLRRFGVPFTYLGNCRLEDPEFERGLRNFLCVCNVVKRFRALRILQIGPRPFDFWSTMCNEGELLEKYRVQLAPIPLVELFRTMEAVERECPEQADRVVEEIREHFEVRVSEDAVRRIAVLKVAVRILAERYGCSAGAIQCWNAFQDRLGIMPCAANSLLNEEGFPLVCETDIHGAITAILCEAAGMGETRTFFADWTVRHPDNENGELLQHCGPWPVSCLQGRPCIGYPLAFDHPGAVEAEAKHGELTLCRFDGDNGEYSLLLGNAKAVEGPYTKGTYLWVEVKDLKKLEAKLVEGPYIHHCVGIHRNVVPVLYEACKYLGIRPDLYDDNEDAVKACIYGGEDWRSHGSETEGE